MTISPRVRENAGRSARCTICITRIASPTVLCCERQSPNLVIGDMKQKIRKQNIVPRCSIVRRYAAKGGSFLLSQAINCCSVPRGKISHSKNKTPGHARGLVRLCAKRTYTLAVFRFLRQPSRPNPTRPLAKSGSEGGTGTTSAVISALGKFIGGTSVNQTPPYTD